jgi:archaellum component FlaC
MNYKIYAIGNYLRIENIATGEIYNGLSKEVFVDKNNLNNNLYKIQNVKDWGARTALNLSQIKKEDGSDYTLSEWETFYTENTGGTTSDDQVTIITQLDEVIAALNTNSTNEQALLISIDNKLEELAQIEDELVAANTTLTNIKTDTTTINTNLETVIDKLDLQVTALEDLKVLVTETNTQLTTANATLTTISNDIATIKNDISLIKADISEIKTSVASINTKLTSVVDSLTAIETKIDTVVTELQTINTTLQTEFDQTQAKLDDVVTALEYAQDTFQVEDCDGNTIGDLENVIKTVVLNKTTVSVCNTSDISDPIVQAINAQSAIGKKQGLMTWSANVGDTLIIPSGKFSTLSLLATKGEFTISNNNNNFTSDLTLSGGSLALEIEISNDGIGTASGATDVAQGIDTRANSNDLEASNNGYTITCVRDGILSLEIYKN